MPKIINIDSEEIVNHILKTKQSVRETATHFGVSKSIVFSKVKQYDGIHKEELEKILQENIQKSRF